MKDKKEAKDLKEKEEKLSFLENVYEWLEAMVYAFITIFILFSFVFRVAGVNGDSMAPTLHNKDWVVISNMNYHPSRGDIVVITQPNYRNEPLIKRVIGLEGDVIDIDFVKGNVFVNGELLQESYIAEQTKEKYDVKFPVTVPKGHVFVMGDNRNHSWDSRTSDVGFIDNRYLLGKASIRLLPFGQFKIGE